MSGARRGVPLHARLRVATIYFPGILKITEIGYVDSETAALLTARISAAARGCMRRCK